MFPLKHTFSEGWAKVTTSFWEKYPHPSLPHVKEAVVLSRFITEQGNLITRRLMYVQQDVPTPLKPFSSGLDNFLAIEETIVNPKQKVLQLRTQN